MEYSYDPAQPITDMRVRTPDMVQERLRHLNGINRLTWREIAKLGEFIGVPAGTLCTICKTGIVPKKHRKLLKVRLTKNIKKIAISKVDMDSASITIIRHIAPEKVKELIIKLGEKWEAIKNDQ